MPHGESIYMANTTSREALLEAQCLQLEEKNAKLQLQNDELAAKLKWYEEQVRLAQHKRFSASSEQTRSDEVQLQLQIFNEAEAEAELAPADQEQTVETVTYQRKKGANRKRVDILENLPVQRVEYRLPAEEQLCPCCSGPLHEMSTEVRRELKMIPAQAVVTEHVQYVYSCRRCDREGTETPVITAPKPNPAAPGSLASSSALAYTMTQKFVDAQPLYRQEQQFARLGVPLSRQTMANWMLSAAETWFEPLYARMHEHLLAQPILHADETTLQVLKEPGRSAATQSYMWLYRTPRDGPPIALFDYQQTRGGHHPQKFLAGFSGFLQVDGYPGYHKVAGAVLVGCWAHARRKFDEALKALPEAERKNPTLAREGLEFCNRLFAIEREIATATPEERLAVRAERSRPTVEAFLSWLRAQKPRTLPKSTLGKAIAYCLNQWDKLTAFLTDGRLELDNNRAERSIKPFVIGRKNWLFSNTPRGARASAVIYSLIETAKENGLKPLPYLTWLFDELPQLPNPMDPAALDEFLPWSPAVPADFRLP